MSRLIGSGKFVSTTKIWVPMFEATLLMGVMFHPISSSDFSVVQFSLLFGMAGENFQVYWA